MTDRNDLSDADGYRPFAISLIAMRGGVDILRNVRRELHSGKTR